MTVVNHDVDCLVVHVVPHASSSAPSPDQPRTGAGCARPRVCRWGESTRRSQHRAWRIGSLVSSSTTSKHSSSAMPLVSTCPARSRDIPSVPTFEPTWRSPWDCFVIAPSIAWRTSTSRTAIATVLRPIDGAGTHTFFSYRVAETLRRFGTFDDNHLLAELDREQRANLATACDSTSWIELLDGGLPANYAAVLARCEVARRSLGLPVDDAVVAELFDRTRRLISANEAGFVDDSEDGAGTRYDIYSADVYLFTAPFAAELEPHWTHGARSVIDLVRAVAATNGAAVTWGRSLGVLAVCHTLELAALAIERALTTDSDVWLGLGGTAADRLADWSDGAVITAHQGRAQDRYRGPDRWLQLTFDCLGKIAWAGGHFRQLGLSGTVESGTVEAAAAVEPFTARDELIVFSKDQRAGVWTYRSPAERVRRAVRRNSLGGLSTRSAQPWAVRSAGRRTAAHRCPCRHVGRTALRSRRRPDRTRTRSRWDRRDMGAHAPVDPTRADVGVDRTANQSISHRRPRAPRRGDARVRAGAGGGHHPHRGDARPPVARRRRLRRGSSNRRGRH